MENLVIKKFQDIFKDKRILIIGNTGFVGSWLSLSLNFFQAKILGLSLKMKNNKYFKKK